MSLAKNCSYTHRSRLVYLIDAIYYRFSLQTSHSDCIVIIVFNNLLKQRNRLLYQLDVRRICHKFVRCKVSTTPSVRVLEINQKRLRWRGLLRAEFRFIRTHTGITIQTFQQTMPSLSFVYQYNAVRGIMN